MFRFLEVKFSIYLNRRVFVMVFENTLATTVNEFVINKLVNLTTL